VGENSPNLVTLLVSTELVAGKANGAIRKLPRSTVPRIDSMKLHFGLKLYGQNFILNSWANFHPKT
jgi:hypothetical protein